MFALPMHAQQAQTRFGSTTVIENARFTYAARVPGKRMHESLVLEIPKRGGFVTGATQQVAAVSRHDHVVDQLAAMVM